MARRPLGPSGSRMDAAWERHTGREAARDWRAQSARPREAMAPALRRSTSALEQSTGSLLAREPAAELRSTGLARSLRLRASRRQAGHRGSDW